MEVWTKGVSGVRAIEIVLKKTKWELGPVSTVHE